MLIQNYGFFNDQVNFQSNYSKIPQVPSLIFENLKKFIDLLKFAIQLKSYYNSVIIQNLQIVKIEQKKGFAKLIFASKKFDQNLKEISVIYLREQRLIKTYALGLMFQFLQYLRKIEYFNLFKNLICQSISLNEEIRMLYISRFYYITHYLNNKQFYLILILTVIDSSFIQTQKGRNYTFSQQNAFGRCSWWNKFATDLSTFICKQQISYRQLKKGEPVIQQFERLCEEDTQVGQLEGIIQKIENFSFGIILFRSVSFDCYDTAKGTIFKNSLMSNVGAQFIVATSYIEALKFIIKMIQIAQSRFLIGKDQNAFLKELSHNPFLEADLLCLWFFMMKLNNFQVQVRKIKEGYDRD
ncbi:unnamed protein product [Paramecium octaurelia]|uniref:Uncharacterized protein n=1 Tax=Paramecium octaurelia TaxID=43137 RepID=A0A8S1VT04_PAROT|nr:unnamed protein product [Paramecium octaurelia]